MKKQPESNEYSTYMLDYSYRVIGPVMYRYVSWVLSESLKRGFKKLYFLARDGYLLCQMAQKICEHMNINIQCEYLYCSRQSLRTPTYHFIGEEAFQLLSLGGYYVTPRSILKRAQISKETQEKILSELSINNADTPLSTKEIDILCQRLRHNNNYVDEILRNSEKAYPATIKYLSSMGIFDSEELAIVDSGWTGSMQRSLRQIMESVGYHGKITGFYFGMYVKPKDERDGEYLTFYFNQQNGIFRKINFNNNLFECMLSANHPMTIGYECNNDVCEPIFSSESSSAMLELIQCQLNGALSYTDKALSDEILTPLSFNYKKARSKCYFILKRAMIKPTKTEAEMYNLFTFCDDVTEGYQMPLSHPEKRKNLRDYIIITRLVKKLCGLKRADEKQLFWPQAAIAHLNPILRPWYRINIFIWDLLKAILKK